MKLLGLILREHLGPVLARRLLVHVECIVSWKVVISWHTIRTPCRVHCRLWQIQQFLIPMVWIQHVTQTRDLTRTFASDLGNPTLGLTIMRLSPIVSRRSYATLSGLSQTARPWADKLSAEWKGTHATGANTKNYIGGEFVESKAAVWHDVVDPVRLHFSLDP